MQPDMKCLGGCESCFSFSMHCDRQSVACFSPSLAVGQSRNIAATTTSKIDAFIGQPIDGGVNPDSTRPAVVAARFDAIDIDASIMGSTSSCLGSSGFLGSSVGCASMSIATPARTASQNSGGRWYPQYLQRLTSGARSMSQLGQCAFATTPPHREISQRCQSAFYPEIPVVQLLRHGWYASVSILSGCP